MALVVEDGTGLSNAESLVSVADADTYNANYGNTSWASASTSDKEIALRKAARFMLAEWAHLLPGRNVKQGQALFIPTTDMVDRAGYTIGYDSVPTQWANANAELGFAALTTDLQPTQTEPGQLASKTIKVDVITISKKWDPSASAKASYQKALGWVSEFFESGGRLVRG